GELEPRLTRLNRLKALSQEYADKVHDSAVAQMASVFSQVSSLMLEQAARANPEFISNRPGFLTSLDSNLEQARLTEPAFIAAAVEARGFLQDEGIRQEYRRTVEELKGQAEATITDVKTEANRAIEEARALAKQ